MSVDLLAARLAELDKGPRHPRGRGPVPPDVAGAFVPYVSRLAWLFGNEAEQGDSTARATA